MKGERDMDDETWLDGLFVALREEAIAISHDFGARVKRKIDLVADSTGIHPPSAAGLFALVSLETANIVTNTVNALKQPARPSEPEPEAPASGDEAEKKK